MKIRDKNNKLLYQNHYQMKKNRLVKLSQVSWKCENCGKEATTVHHKDGTKHNHKIKNLKALCSKCHGKLHGRPHKYGKLSLEELGKKYNISPATARRRFIKGKPLHKKVYKYGNLSLKSLGKKYGLSSASIKTKLLTQQPLQRTSKFIRLYGSTLKEISNKLKMPESQVYQIHLQNKLNYLT